ncbi:hypothetical protein Glove_184g103 [Diversispora epigaea]|uniref:Crinkler effector protein N-terminal domain-containing protein n=1 Tax=Diversispora epigaea TaxID=1348612 RepID=A0A397ITW8_9GLOM|nr:hypothetical protein Glove_184g103 [Diversispora epigaea]
MEVSSSKKPCEDEKEKKESGVLKRLVKELSTNISEISEEGGNGNSSGEFQPHNFLYFFSMITHAESKNDTTNQEFPNKITKKALRKRTEKAWKLYKLFDVVVHGSTFRNAFSVKIKKKETVDDLKEAIKKKKHPEFESFASDRLTLWKVNIPFNTPNDKQDALEKDPNVDISTVLEGDELSPMDYINEYFDKPARKHLHIIVELPASFASPSFPQDTITKINEMYDTITQTTIGTISISKIDTGNFRLLKQHFNFKIESFPYNNIPIHSNVSPPAFKWIEKTKPAQRDEYLEWLRQYIPLTNGRVWHDVKSIKNLLDVYKDSRLPFNVHGGTDVVVVNECDIENDLIPESIYAVLKLKKNKIERPDVMQVILEMVVADLITSDNRIVFGILSDLRDDWRVYWLEDDRKIKCWKASSRDAAVQVISKLLCNESSEDNTEDISTIIPAAKRVKLDTMIQNRTTGEDDIAQMEDIYDVMSKEEIWHHKVGIASEIVRNIPSFSSMYV